MGLVASVTEDACRGLTGLTVPPDTRFVMEKPFGSDTVSADKLNGVLTRLVPEDQIHRMDHYLGMSTVLNILGLRYTNRMLESVLDFTHVASVDISLMRAWRSRAAPGTTTTRALWSTCCRATPFTSVLPGNGAAEHYRPAGRTRRRSRGAAGHPGVGERPSRQQSTGPLHRRNGRWPDAAVLRG